MTETNGEDQAPSVVTEDKLMTIEQDLVSKKEEEVVKKDPQILDHTVIPGKMVIDQLHQAQPRGTFPEDIGDHIQETNLIDNTPETEMEDQDLEETKEPISHHIVREDPQETQETVITAEINKEKEEETLIRVPARKETATERETLTQEERTEVKARMAKTTNQHATAVDQPII